MTQTTITQHRKWRIVFTPYVTDEDREIARLYLGGESHRRIAELLGTTEERVGRRLDKLRRYGELGRR